MLEIGLTVQGRVERVENYGFYLSYDQWMIIVPIPEVSWTPQLESGETSNVGDKLACRILRYNYNEGLFVGSVRLAHPELNPYRELSQFEPGYVLNGKISKIEQESVRIELHNNAVGYIQNYDLNSALKVGDFIQVVISSLEVDQGMLGLRPLA